jgi:hypothetical protein
MKASRLGLTALFGLLLVLGGCASTGSSGGGGATSNPNLITRAQLDQVTTSDLYDAVRRLRPNWLTARGPSTLIGEQAQVAVYLDGARLGTATALRGINFDSVTQLEYLSPADATNRYGTDHQGGVIIVRTR